MTAACTSAPPATAEACGRRTPQPAHQTMTMPSPPPRAGTLETDDLAAFSRALAAWAYETAFTPVREAARTPARTPTADDALTTGPLQNPAHTHAVRQPSHSGTAHTLAEALNGGNAERLSPWWTSLLYERHPAMTPALFSLYQQYWCKNPPPPVSPWRRRYTALRQRLWAAAQPCYALLRFAHWLWTVRRLLPPATLPSWGQNGTSAALAGMASAPAATFSPDVPQAVTVAAYFPACDAQAAAQGRFRSHYWENLHTLLDVPPATAAPHSLTAGGLHWLLLRMRTPEQSLREQLALRDRFRAAAPAGITLHFMEEFLPWRGILRAVRRFLRLLLASWRAEAAFRNACTLRRPTPCPCADGRTPLSADAASSKPASPPPPRMRTAPSANFYPLLRTAYAMSFRGWRGLERCLLDEALHTFSAQAGPQRLTLLPQENCPWERLLTYALRRHGTACGPVIGAQHATVRPADFRYVDDARTFTQADCRRFQPDVLALNGLHARHLLCAAGLPPERLRDVEALRYQHTPPPLHNGVAENPVNTATAHSAAPSADAFPTRQHIYSPASGHHAHRTASPPHPQDSHSAAEHSRSAAVPPSQPPRRLLLLTGFFAPETTVQLRLLAAGDAAGLLHGWQITIKGHPWRDPRRAARACCPPALFARLTFSTAPLPELFARRPALVWTANSTTAAVDAAYAGLPLLVTAPDGTFDLCPLAALPALPRAATPAHIAAALAAPRTVALPPDWLRRDAGLRRWQALLTALLRG